MPQNIKRPFDVVIIPGSRHTPQEYWYPQLANQLTSKGLNVLYPEFPPVERQTLTNWNSVLASFENRFTDKTIFVGHSLGGRFLMNYFQDHKAGAVFFVSAHYERELALWKFYMMSDPEARNLFENLWKTTNQTFFSEDINWDKIVDNVKKIHLFYSENDNLITLAHAFNIQRRIGGEIHWIKNGRHLDIPLESFPELTETILKTYKEINASNIEGQRKRMRS